MPLTGVMAHGDQRLPVPGHPGVHLQAAAETSVDVALIGNVLGQRGPAMAPASRRGPGRVRQPAALACLPRARPGHLTYSGPPDAAERAACPPVIDFTVRGVTRRASPCLPVRPVCFSFQRPSSAGLVPDPGDPGVTSGDPGVRSGDPARGRVLQLTVRGYGEARQQQARLRELIAAWDAAGRPGPGHLRIDAYHSGVMPPDTGDIVHVTPHATVVISSSRA